jgi:hypothetical protein
LITQFAGAVGVHDDSSLSFARTATLNTRSNYRRKIKIVLIEAV